MRGRVTSHATRCTSRVHLAQLQGLSLRLPFRSEISGLGGTKPTLTTAAGVLNYHGFITFYVRVCAPRGREAEM